MSEQHAFAPLVDAACEMPEPIQGAGRSLIEAFMAAAGRHPQALLTVSSERRAAEDRLAAIVAEGRGVGDRLRALGVRPGDCVGVQLPAWREWLVACVAVAQAGAVLVPIVSIYGARELGFVLRQSRERVLITPDRWRSAHYAETVASCGDLPGLLAHIVVGDAVAGTLAWETLLTGDVAGAPVPRLPDDLAMLIYTSGTTSDPKGVRHSNRTLLSEIITYTQSRHSGAADVTLSPWPPGHIAGAIQLMRFLVEGARIVAMDQWDPAAAANLMERHRVTGTSGTPFHLTGLLDAADRGGQDLSSLVSYTVGAAPVPPTLIARCARRGLETFRSYGSTEHPTVTAGDPSDPLGKRLATEGRLLPGTEIRFVDDEGNDAPAGDSGEIATRGPELFLGYLDAALDDAAFLPDGWYLSGDIGRLDAEGFLLVTDRKKDIIIRGGENISSRDVEDLLLTDPTIAEAAAVAAPDARMGEIVRAYIVPRAGAAVTLQTLRAHFAASGITKQKLPEQIVILTAMPRNATGKILKHELRAHARADSSKDFA